VLFRERMEIVLAVLFLGSLVLVTPRIAESDAVEYFSYLPSILLDGDLDFTNEYTYFYEEDPQGRAGFKETFLDRSTATGLKLNFGPIGTALLWSPFYLATHGALLAGQALGLDVQPDGLSQPYRTAVSVASAFYGLAGLFLCYRLARRYAAPFVSALAVIAVWWATPVAYYLYIAPGMSHAVSLFAVALFFSLWPWVLEEPNLWRRWCVWGASAGLMALVREQDVLFSVVALIAALSPSLHVSAVARIRRLAAFGLAAALVFVPQLVVYQILNGRPTPSPYVQRKMYWLSPHFFEVLFSPEHGLVFWSPILLLFAAGAFLFLKRNREAGLALVAGFLTQVYISGSVDSWTQAGAFGSRRFVDTTVIFAVWGAVLLAALEPRIKRIGTAAIVAVVVIWNVGLMVQFGLGIMDRQRLVWSDVIHDQFHEVPPRLLSVARRYFTARGELAGGGSDGK
jgi:hypothetical protein